MRFRPLIQNSSCYFSRLKRVCRTQTLTSTEHHISSLHLHFWVQPSSGSAFPQPDKTRKFLRFFIIDIIIIIIIFTVTSSFLYQFKRDFSALRNIYSQNLYQSVAIHLNYVLLVLLFHLLKYLGLKSAKSFDHAPKTILYQEI